ncbi:hypothetical protein GMDG_07862 [Pseudogymnoascus destructans 20631-21]|uniref:Uncharacterized protein n=1 Tax=Pseudogymnoascus destructans (strain ATCC MYA-4855 / 20631-21) TaxID=658429 RepID=L8FZD3_PSED2|nr:hypothetical protein GMDG_07862 [Pseudogymnoascus destructans 20631-21]
MFGDIWDLDINQPITPPSLTPQKSSEARRAIERLIAEMPQALKAVLHTTAFSTYDPSDPPRNEYFVQYEKTLTPLYNLKFTTAYKVLRIRRLQKVTSQRLLRMSSRHTEHAQEYHILPPPSGNPSATATAIIKLATSSGASYIAKSKLENLWNGSLNHFNCAPSTTAISQPIISGFPALWHKPFGL